MNKTSMIQFIIVLDKILLNNTNHRSKNLTRKSSRSSNANSCNICKQNYLRTKVELH